MKKTLFIICALLVVVAEFSSCKVHERSYNTYYAHPKHRINY